MITDGVRSMYTAEPVTYRLADTRDGNLISADPRASVKADTFSPTERTGATHVSFLALFEFLLNIRDGDV